MIKQVNPKNGKYPTAIHKKNQSTPGGPTNEILGRDYNKVKQATIDHATLAKGGFNQSVNSNLSGNGKKHSKQQRMAQELKAQQKAKAAAQQNAQNDRIRKEQGEKLTNKIEKQYSNINLSN